HELVRSRLHQRTDRLMAESRISLADDSAEGHILQLVPDKGFQDAESDFRIGESAQCADVVRAERGPFAWHVKAAVARQAGEKRIRKAEGGGAAARAHIIHQSSYPGRVMARAYGKAAKPGRILVSRLI